MTLVARTDDEIAEVLYRVDNRYQGDARRVLVACHAGLLRSPTVANILVGREYNARSCGVLPSYALIMIDAVLVKWADVVVFVTPEVLSIASAYVDLSGVATVTLQIDDNYNYNDEQLVHQAERQLTIAGLTRNASDRTVDTTFVNVTCEASYGDHDDEGSHAFHPKTFCW